MKSRSGLSFWLHALLCLIVPSNSKNQKRSLETKANSPGQVGKGLITGLLIDEVHKFENMSTR